MLRVFAILKIFMGHSFKDDDGDLVDKFMKFFEVFGFDIITGERPEARGISAKVRKRIRDSDGAIILFTRDQRLRGKTWTTSAWLIEEKTYAFAHRKYLALFLEDSVDPKQIGGLQADHEYIPFDREDLIPALTKAIPYLEDFKRRITRAKQKSYPTRVQIKQSKPSLNAYGVAAGVVFYPQRVRATLDDLLSQIKSHGIFIGTELGTVMELKPQLKKIVQRGGLISFYLPNPRSDAISIAQRCNLVADDTDKTLPGMLRRFHSLKQWLGTDGKRISLSLYNCPPVHSMIVVDPDSKNAQIQVESYLYDVKAPNRASILISKKLQPEAYQKYFDSAKWIMAHSKLKE